MRRVARLLVVSIEALLDLALRLIALPAVALLQRTGELVHRAVDPVEVVVGELAPPLLDLTAHLLPLAGENVLVHRVSPPFGHRARIPLASHTKLEPDVCRGRSARPSYR